MASLSRVSIAHGCRARQCSLLYLAKFIPCCRARTWRVLNKIGVVLFPAPKGFQCAVWASSWDGLVSEEQHRSTAAHSCRARHICCFISQSRSHIAAHEQLRAINFKPYTSSLRYSPSSNHSTLQTYSLSYLIVLSKNYRWGLFLNGLFLGTWKISIF
jgi:hypothetical protein